MNPTRSTHPGPHPYTLRKCSRERLFTFNRQFLPVNILTPLQSALPQNAPITRLESALPKTLNLKRDYILDARLHSC